MFLHVAISPRLIEAHLAKEMEADKERQIALKIKQIELEGVAVFKAQQAITEDCLTMRCAVCYVCTRLLLWVWNSKVVLWVGRARTRVYVCV
jgi:hypothetical protein